MTVVPEPFEGTKLVEIVMHGEAQLLIEMTGRDVDDLLHAMRIQAIYRIGSKYIVTTQIMWVNLEYREEDE
jgi:hypothetical protein